MHITETSPADKSATPNSCPHTSILCLSVCRLTCNCACRFSPHASSSLMYQSTSRAANAHSHRVRLLDRLFTPCHMLSLLFTPFHMLYLLFTPLHMLYLLFTLRVLTCICSFTLSTHASSPGTCRRSGRCLLLMLAFTPKQSDCFTAGF